MLRENTDDFLTYGHEGSHLVKSKIYAYFVSSTINIL